MTGQKADNVEARQFIVDLYGCQVSYIDDVDYIKSVIHQACEAIGAGIVEECYHKFSPIGISAVAVITTSHISVHTWPEYGYAAVDIFSCQEDIPGEIGRLLAEALKAEHTETRMIKRALRREDKDGEKEWGEKDYKGKDYKGKDCRNKEVSHGQDIAVSYESELIHRRDRIPGYGRD